MNAMPVVVRDTVAPHAGAWIEMWPYGFHTIGSVSLPMRERGLK